jgi:hypothetical protein
MEIQSNFYATQKMSNHGLTAAKFWSVIVKGEQWIWAVFKNTDIKRNLIRAILPPKLDKTSPNFAWSLDGLAGQD